MNVEIIENNNALSTTNRRGKVRKAIKSKYDKTLSSLPQVLIRM